MSSEKRQKILLAAMDVFLKQGYRRVNMIHIAESLKISRPGLYLYFKTKEEIFNAVVLEFGTMNVERARIEALKKKSLRDKLQKAFDVYVGEIFDLTLKSPEAREVSDSSLQFAKSGLDESYRKFELLLASILKEHRHELSELGVSFERCAHLLVSSARGFKLVATSSKDLRKLIQQMLDLSLQL